MDGSGYAGASMKPSIEEFAATERDRYMAERGPGENPPVAELLTMISGALDGAHKALENLVQKVRPVTGEARPSDEAIKAAPPTQYSSPVAEELARILNSIGTLETHAIRVAERVEV